MTDILSTENNIMTTEPSEDEVHKLAKELAVVLDLAPRRPPWDGLHKIARHVSKMRAPRPEDVAEVTKLLEDTHVTSGSKVLYSELASAIVARYGVPPHPTEGMEGADRAAGECALDRVSGTPPVAEVKRLRAALAYYADPDHWEYGDVPGHVYAHDDAGGFARKALGMPSPIPAGERLEIELECRRIMEEEFEPSTTLPVGAMTAAGVPVDWQDCPKCHAMRFYPSGRCMQGCDGLVMQSPLPAATILVGSGSEEAPSVTHERAREAARRLIAGSFRRVDMRPCFSIPARPDEDDDLVLMAYIRQQEHETALRASAAPKVDADIVGFYEREFYPLSNFSAFTLMWWVSPRDGLQRFDTSEAVYQWEKFNGNVPTSVQLSIQRAIRNAPSAHEAFKIAEVHRERRRPKWDDEKVDVMLRIIRAKAAQHEYVRRKLLETGDRYLVEDSWRDDFWGWGPNKDGRNELGKLWMIVRDELRSGALTAALAARRS